MKNNRSLPKPKSAILILAVSVILIGGCKTSEIDHVSAANCGEQVDITTQGIPVLEVDGCQFRDLNRNHQLDTYEDWRLSESERAESLLSIMTLQEKVGQLLHGNAFNNAPFGAPATGYNQGQIRAALNEQHITYFVSMLALPPAQLAEANNSLQRLAEDTRLGIPIVISTDPRHHFQETTGASVKSAGFTQFPETLGFAALNDTELTRQFADIVRREYRAVGFSMSLSPQADLSTEPRWPRINGTFGEDAEIAKRMVGAYISGIQKGSTGLQSDSVASVVKHWVGYGAAKDGLDAHNYYGRYADLSTEQLDYHVEPFKGAFSSKVAGVMPAYPIFKDIEINGESSPEVAAAYNKPMLSLLRKTYDFEGVILSDWAITNDCESICRDGFPDDVRPSFEGISTAWGVEELSEMQRFAKALGAGIDQFGGVLNAQPLLAAIDQGLVSETRINESVLRVLTQSFSLGLFEAPFVDPETVMNDVATSESQSLTLEIQAKSMVLLKNSDDMLPLSQAKSSRVYLLGDLNGQIFKDAGFTVVENSSDADFAIIKTAAPYETLYLNFFFGSIQHDGSLAFTNDDPVLQSAREISKTIPVILSVYLDRPAILTPFKEIAQVIIANFGASDQALVNALTGTEKAQGQLPFELPSSMQAVKQQSSDKPSDSKNPNYPLFYKVNY